MAEFFHGKGAFFKGNAGFSQFRHQRGAGAARQDGVTQGAGADGAGRVHNPEAGRGPFGHHAGRLIKQHSFNGALFARRLTRQAIRQQIDGFDIAARPAEVWHGNGCRPPAIHIGRIRGDALHRHHQGGRDGLIREGMIAPRHAARDLHVKQTFRHAIAPRHFAQNKAQRRKRHRHGKLDFAQGTFQTRQVQILINEAAIE